MVREHGRLAGHAKQFPLGMEEAVATIREFGMIPGIWFEFENCGSQCDIFSNTDMLLNGWPAAYRRNTAVFGPAQTGSHRLSDGKGHRFLKKYGFGYLKIDYNDTVGIGCDGAESLGEGCGSRFWLPRSLSGRSSGRFPIWSSKTVLQAATPGTVNAGHHQHVVLLRCP